MAVELGDISLDHLTDVTVRERARIVRYAVPGLEGDLAQTLGRPSVEVDLRGIFYGAEAGEQLSGLRDVFHAREPVDFFAEAVGEGFFSEVLISELEIRQRAGFPDQFDFNCRVVEWVEPPSPGLADPLAAIDAELDLEATAFIDDIGNALAEVAALTDLITNIPSFGDPTVSLAGMIDGFTGSSGDSSALLETVEEDL